MKTLYQTLLLALAGTAIAQVPSTNDTSDGNANTGMGTFALGGPAATNGGSYNTASGFEALHSNTTGSWNTASGTNALQSNTTGNYNTADGALALAFNTIGNFNTALGSAALYTNSTGGYNTGAGYGALNFNKTGNYNTATGYLALFLTTSSNNAAFGSYALASYDLNYAGEGGNTAIGAFSQAFVSAGEGFNTAVGEYALEGVGSLNSLTTTGSTGRYNTAVGVETLYLFTTASYNAALGMQALNSTTTGNYNTALGYQALYSNVSGWRNTAVGVEALNDNDRGGGNTAVGMNALRSSRGFSNTALGWKAGHNVTTGNNNIEIGSEGDSTDTAVIRIGTQSTQSATFIAGIAGATVSGSPVYVSSSGQLGLQSSSERFKTAITPMGASTAKLEELRPVTFQYKTDTHGARQYGLIAEEVAKVYPELVVRDAKGQIISMRYDELAPMLLNEMQKKNAAQDAEIRELKQQMAVLSAALQKIQAKDEMIAQR